MEIFDSLIKEELNVKDSINAFPCTDEDFIIIAARKALKGEQL